MIGDRATMQRNALLLVAAASFIVGANSRALGDGRSASVVSAASIDVDRKDLERVFAQWQAQQSDIATAQVAYRCFHNSVSGRKTVADLNRILESGRVDSSPTGFKAFIAEMNGRQFRTDPPWGLGRIVRRGEQRRSELGPFTTVADRAVCVDFDSLNVQFDASDPGESLLKSADLELFRPVPPGPWTPDRWRIVERRSNELVLRRVVSLPDAEPVVLDSRHWVVESESGLVQRWFRMDPTGPDQIGPDQIGPDQIGPDQIGPDQTGSDKTGQLHSCARYLEWADLGGGISMPRLVVEATVLEGVVAVMRVIAIDTMTVNVAVSESEFILPAPRNARIVDHRGVSKMVSQLEQEQADIVSWLKDHAPARPAATVQVVSGNDSLRNVILTVNGVLLVGIGVLVWKRQRQALER